MPKYTTTTVARYWSDVQASEQGNDSLQEFIDSATAEIDQKTARTWQRPQTTGYLYLDGNDTTQLELANTDLQYVLGLYIDDDDDGTYTRVHAESRMLGALDDSTTTVTVDDTSDFPSTGTLLIDSELITYTGTTSTEFTGCTRGASSTTAAAHDDRSAVYWTSNNYIKVYPEAGLVTLLDDAALNVFTARPKAVKIRYLHGGVVSTTLDTAISATDSTTATVHTTVGFPTEGHIIIDSEWMTYTGTTATTFTGLTRGAFGTTAATHADESVVYEAAPDDVRLLCNQIVSGYMHTDTEDDLKGKIKSGISHLKWTRPYVA